MDDNIREGAVVEAHTIGELTECQDQSHNVRERSKEHESHFEHKRTKCPKYSQGLRGLSPLIFPEVYLCEMVYKAWSVLLVYGGHICLTYGYPCQC